MKIKLIFNVLALVLFANFSLAKDEQKKRKRPIIDTTAQDSEGNYIDQIAAESVNYSSTNLATENYPRYYHTATDEFRKPLKKLTTDQKVHYVTPEPYSHSFTENYVNEALKNNENLKSKSPASSFFEYSTVTQHDTKTIPKIQRQKVYSSENEDYNYYFPESKRIATKATKKSVKDPSEKFYKPQAPGAVITKDLKTNGDENVNTYHYYYPEVPSYDKKSHQTFPSSTLAPSTTTFPKIKFPSKKTPASQQTSTDSYQYQPVLQRPNDFFASDEDFYPSFDTKKHAVHSTLTPSTASPIKMLRPTKKNNFYLPTGSTTARPKIRRPSTDSPFKDVKQFSVSPSPSTAPHYSTTHAPVTYKYSTPSPVSSTTFSDFYIKPSTQVTPTASVELQHDGSERTVHIRPKKTYQKIEDYVYKPKKTESFQHYDGFESKKTEQFVNFDAEKNENFDSFTPKIDGKFGDHLKNDENFDNFPSKESKYTTTKKHEVFPSKNEGKYESFTKNVENIENYPSRTATNFDKHLKKHEKLNHFSSEKGENFGSFEYYPTKTENNFESHGKNSENFENYALKTHQAFHNNENYPAKKVKSFENHQKNHETFQQKPAENFESFSKNAESFDDFYSKNIETYEKFEPKATVKQTNLNAYDNFDSTSSGDTFNFENPEQKDTVKQTIIYKFVPEETYGSKEIFDYPNGTYFHSTAATYPESHDVYNDTNLQSYKNYKYEYFTEQDAGRMPSDDSFDLPKMDDPQEVVIDDKQRASKKNMFYEYTPHLSDDYSVAPENINERELPPPMHEITGDRDNDAEASKNQYFVLYSIDDDEKEKKQRKYQKRKSKPEQGIVYHHHHHQLEEKPEDFHSFDQEFDSEFDSELTNSDNVRIVDPNVRGGRPIEFTKDDYLRHIKQAVVQYMKENSPGNLAKTRIHHQDSETPYRPTKSPAAATTATSYRHTIPSQQIKPMAPLKLPKNVYTAGKLKDAIDELHESPHVDLTIKKHKQKPFDLSAIDVGQTYQHVSHFDHSAALKNFEDFDQTNHQSKPKLHFSQQTYHDINNLGFNRPKHHTEEFEGEHQGEKLFQGYTLPKKYKGSLDGSSYSYGSMSYDSSKLPKIISTRGQSDDDEDDSKVEDPVGAPIQIINGIPVANPYNIDLNTLKYMLGGIAQAEVNDQLKDLDDSNSQQAPKWNSHSPNPFGAYSSNSPVYKVYGQDNSQRAKKNSGQTSSHSSSSQKFPLVESLMNYNKNKLQQKSKLKNARNSNKNSQVSNYSEWSQTSKKQRGDPQTSSSNSHFVLRPVMKNKQAKEENFHQKSNINRVRKPQLPTEMRPPLPPKQRPATLILKKVT